MRWWLVLPLATVVTVVGQPADNISVTADNADVAALLAARGDHDRAIQLYQDLLGSADSLAVSVQVRRGLARSLLMAGRPAEAASTLARAMELFPEDAGLQRVAAGLYSSQGQYAQAIGHLQRAIALEPDQATDHANLGGLYTNLGSYDKAERALLHAVALAPEDAIVQRRLGGLYLQRHRYDDAVEHLTQSARLEPMSPTTPYLLGQVREGLAEPEQALEAYEQARRLDPSYMDAHYRAAQLARRLGRFALADSAMVAYTHLQSVGGNDVDALKQMRLLRDAIVESGDQPDHVFALAQFLFDQGYLDESENRLEAVLRQQPDNYRAHNQLGNVHLRRRSAALALVEYEAAFRIAPMFAPAALNAGNACMLLKEPGRALPYYERVVALSPDVAMAWYGLGSAHLALGRTDVATRVLQQGLDTTHPEGRTKAAFLEQLRKARLK
ncbi:MAG: tetratricopeptide repeat protein [bacterium]|nr:tetratricopeptide repeat protein [bacterium]